MPSRPSTQTRHQRDAPIVDVADMTANTTDEIASEDEGDEEGHINDAAGEDENEGEEQEEDGEEEEEEEEQDDEVPAELEEVMFPPPGLKEISSLASWTVSTAKPGNGVAALRSPDTSMFWQSDGPQPHLLSIHFFKLVSIVHMRIFLDFQSDESYTPTKIQFLAGMGVHDIQEFAEMSFEQPTGWIDVDFSNVGPVIDDDEDEDMVRREVDWSRRPVLRAFLVQVRILENHQNGKDTHLRAVQLFARDDVQQARGPAPPSTKPTVAKRLTLLSKGKAQHLERNNIKRASWMMEPDLR
ncbi:unnamed protein product [Zymoseptoria tritici ST99CH_3D7]|uniref:DOC domain-containing protein n=1 Tax=Zymoseptoria tritici (strain ST99CH_3D7) TaxID=1276538 RepID=A0A1X7RKI6_ZYMT9|nr:unnamed protein product [Zymoseptoria tritici ST99CH_3D7]